MDTTDDLAAIRRDIDALDAEMRSLLRARSDLVARVAAQKAQNGSSAPLRPLREAQQMAELAAWQADAAPHLPLPGLVAVWREIIGMALAQQGGLTVTATAAALPLARAHFGASLAYQTAADAAAATAALAAPRTVAVLAAAEAVAPPAGCEIFARLPVYGAAAAFCYGPCSTEPQDDAALRLLVCRAAALPGDVAMADTAAGVLVETDAAGADPVWGRYLAATEAGADATGDEA